MRAANFALCEKKKTASNDDGGGEIIDADLLQPIHPNSKHQNNDKISEDYRRVSFSLCHARALRPKSADTAISKLRDVFCATDSKVNRFLILNHDT